MEKIGLSVFFILIVFPFDFPGTQADDVTPSVNCSEILIHSNCQLKITTESTQQISSALSNPKTRFIRLNPIVRPYYSDEFWRTENRSDEIGKYFWVWTDGDIGRRFLSLDYNFVEMSLWTLSPGVGKININLLEVQQGCWVTLNVTEQFCTIASLFRDTVHEKAVAEHDLQDSVVCYNTLDLTTFKLNKYQCSEVYNGSNVNFSIEIAKSLNSNLYAAISILPILFYFLPFFYVLLFPNLFTVRYSQKFLDNMKLFEINGPKAKTPLGVLFSLDQGNKKLAFLALLCFTYPLALLAILFWMIVDYVHYRDCTNWISFPAVIIGLFIPQIIFTGILFIIPLSKYENCKTNNSNRVLQKLLRLMQVPEVTSNAECIISSYLGDYISVKYNMETDLLDLRDYIKYVFSHLKSDEVILSVKRIIFLPIFLFLVTPFFSLLVHWIPLTKQSPYFGSRSSPYSILQLPLVSYIPLTNSISSAIFMSVMTQAVSGAIINYETVMPYVILGLSVFYYTWHPFHDLQEEYRILKAIVFKECSSSGPKYIRRVLLNDSDSNSVSDSEDTPMLRSDTTPANYESVPSSQRGNGVEERNEQCIMLYKSDGEGLESIPKDLWVSIYRKLLPLDVCMVKATVTSIATVVMTIFLVLTLLDFHKETEIPFIGQGIASFITVALPSLVFGLINTDVNKEGLKRMWKVAVREKVKIYIQDNEIPNPVSVN